MSGFAIHFRLQDVNAITPWGQPGDQSLGWFGLTYGCYCIETPQGRLLETPRPHGPFPEPWDDYQVARLFDDLLAPWPAITEPVPDDIFQLIDTGFEAHIDALHASDDRDDDEDFWDAVSVACEWLNARRISMLHLASAPGLHLWRTGDTLRLRWVATPRERPECADHWTVARADCSFAFAEVERGVRLFVDDFLGAMAARVGDIQRNGWTRDCALDLDLLVKAQRDNEAWAAKTLASVTRTDWDATRAALRAIRML